MSSTQPIQSQAFNQLGNLTRTLHEALRELGYDRTLAKVREEIPDARDRLVYVSKLTEEAANKVLAAVEKGQPECEAVQARGRELAQTLRRRSQADITPIAPRTSASRKVSC
jgi:chemotaxis protein CheZ